MAAAYCVFCPIEYIMHLNQAKTSDFKRRIGCHIACLLRSSKDTTSSLLVVLDLVAGSRHRGIARAQVRDSHKVLLYFVVCCWLFLALLFFVFCGHIDNN